MTIQEIQDRVTEIEANGDDEQMCEALERMLLWDFIRFLADNPHGEASVLAQEVLRADVIRFKQFIRE